jgi:hypothetical protein
MWGLFVPLRKAARIGRVRRLAVGFAAVALCGGLLTQAAVADPLPPPAPPNSGTGNVNWGGFGWGLGIAADFDTGGTRVASAQIVTSGANSIVRVTDSSSNVGVSFVLEAHYFFTNWNFNAVPQACNVKNDGTYANASNCTLVGIGPFIAIEVGGGTSATPSSSSPITGYALGVLFGLHHPKTDPSTGKAVTNDTSSWNFGIGFRVDPKAQVLGDGFAPNAPPPAGETMIRYKTEPRPGVMLLSSFSF